MARVKTTCKAADCQTRFDKHGNKKFCSAACRQREHQRQKKLPAGTVVQTRHGPTARAIETLGLWDLYRDGELSSADVRDLLAENGHDVAANTVNTSLQALRIQQRLRDASGTWQMADDVRWMLCLDPWPSLDEIEADPQVLEDWLDKAVEAFVAFRDRFFRHKRGKYITKDFHRKWIRAVLKALVTGGKQLILSPPRHGKSELLQHFVVWLICRDPDISILWISKRLPVAKQTARAIKDHLERNTELIEAVLPPNQSFAPPSRTSSAGWGAEDFTVSCRTTIGQKSSTVLAVGRGSAILSLDVDFIVQDDIEDHSSTQQDGERQKTKEWDLQDLDSRKEEHTAWLQITSRVHPEDLANDRLDDPEWEVIVDQAHDPTCQIDPDNEKAHVDCMLFPEVRSYRWLMSKFRSFMARGLIHLWHMIYQNDPQPAGVAFFTRELISLGHDPTRGLGIPTEKRGAWKDRLVAGLDPAATGTQAAYLWAVEFDVVDHIHPYDRTPGSMSRVLSWQEHMVDLDETVGGGVDEFVRVARDWRNRYGLRHWVVEANLVRVDFWDHPHLVAFLAQYPDTVIEEHETHNNRTDPYFGIGAMRTMYRTTPTGLPIEDDEPGPRRITLPVGTKEARLKVESYTKHAVRFTDDNTRLSATGVRTRRKPKTDILDASWFPQKVIRRWVNEMEAMLQDQASDTGMVGTSMDFAMSDYDLDSWE